MSNESMETVDADSAGTETPTLPKQTRPTVRPLLIWVVLTLAAGGIVIGYVSGNRAQFGGPDTADIIVQAVAAVVGLIELRFLIRMYILQRTRYIIRSGTVEREYSLLYRTSSREVPIEQIRSHELQQSRIQKLFGYGTIRVNQGLGPVTFENLPNPHEFQDTLKALLLD